MRILADENCEIRLVRRLREAGHDVLHALEMLRGASDTVVREYAIREQRVLLTNDLDFGLLAEQMREHPPAVVLLRLDPLSASARMDVVSSFFAGIGHAWQGKFFVLEPGSIRERAIGAYHRG
jgi:predicted nuclease of predicted toxin-antitoxin system